METIEFKKRIYKLPIIALHGNEVFYIGMPFKDLNEILWNHFTVHGEQQNDGFCMIYNIQLEKSIKLTLDIMARQVYRIEFLREYKGLFDGLRIGCTVKELCDRRNDVFFDEEYILVGKYPHDYILTIDNLGNAIYNLDDVYENKITKVIVENKKILTPH